MNMEILSNYIFDYWRGSDPELIELVEKRNCLSSLTPRAAALLKDNVFIDACAYHLSGRNWQTDTSYASAICFNILEAGDTSVNGVVRQMAEYQDVINKNGDVFMNILRPEDILEAQAKGKLGIILSGQTCDFISYKYIEAYVELFQRMGLRTMNLAYNHRTFAADGSRTGTDAGLTPQGKRLIKAMNRYGVTIDLSHVGKNSAKEAMMLTESPVIYSHSNPEKLFPGSRSITDEEAQMCAATGGVVCVSGYAPTLRNGKDPVTIDRFSEAIAYYADLIGIEHVGIGIDSMVEPGTFDVGDTKMMCQRVLSHHEDAACYWDNYDAGYGRESVSTAGIYGIADHGNIIENLLVHGFTDQEIARIMGGNLLRVFKESWR